MGKATVKLYRDPEAAIKAIKALRQQGYSLEEIGLIAAPVNTTLIEELKGGVSLTSPQGAMVAAGAAAKAINSQDPEQGLREALDIPADIFGYYRFGVAMGGVLVSVQASEERLGRAAGILRQAAGLGVEKTTCPGFDRAARMTESDPVDAKMTGDFRRY